MSLPGGPLFIRLRGVGKSLGQAARLMVGMPDYDTYVAHMQSKHPELPLMSYPEFFRDRQEARYGGRKGQSPRCC